MDPKDLTVRGRNSGEISDQLDPIENSMLQRALDFTNQVRFICVDMQSSEVLTVPAVAMCDR